MTWREGEAACETMAKRADSTSRLWQLLLLALTAGTVTYARFMLSPIQEAMRIDLGLSDSQVALIQGPAIAVPMALFAIPAGLVLHRFAFARLIPCLIGVVLAATGFAAFAHDFVSLALSRCLAGLALPALLVAAYAGIGSLFSAEQRGRATTLVIVGETIGAPAVFAAGGLVLGHLGTAAEYWRDALLALCLPLIPISLLMFGTSASVDRQAASIDLAPGKTWAILWSRRRLCVPLLLARVMFWLSIGNVLVWAAPAFARGLALPPERIGVLIGSALLASSLAGPVLAGVMADRCQRVGGPRRTMAMTSLAALLSVPLAFFPIMPDPLFASVALAGFLIVGNVTATVEMAVILVMLPPIARSTYVGTSIALGSLFCYALAPMLVSGLSILVGGSHAIERALAAVCALTSVAGSLLFLWGRCYQPAMDEPER